MLGAFKLEDVDVLSILTASTVSRGTDHSPVSCLLTQECKVPTGTPRSFAV